MPKSLPTHPHPCPSPPHTRTHTPQAHAALSSSPRLAAQAPGFLRQESSTTPPSPLVQAHAALSSSDGEGAFNTALIGRKLAKRAAPGAKIGHKAAPAKAKPPKSKEKKGKVARKWGDAGAHWAAGWFRQAGDQPSACCVAVQCANWGGGSGVTRGIGWPAVQLKRAACLEPVLRSPA